MAKKKTPVVEEVPVAPEAPQEPEMDYTKVHETPIEQLVGEPDETAAKEIVAEEKIETPPKEDTVEIEWDPAKFEADMTKKMGEVSEESAKKILEQVTKQKEPETEVEPELISPWAKEGRTPKDYEEIADWAVEKKRLLDERSAKAAQIAQAAQSEAQKAANEQEISRFNAYVDSQIGELIEAGKIPAVENSLNPDDPGIVARKQLFQTMLDVNLERQKSGKQPIYSVKEIYYEHFANAPVAEEEPAGADAPVSPGKAAPSGEPKEVSYNEIHRKSLFDILTGK